MLDEVAGIAAGAAVTFAEAFCLSLLDEVWAHARTNPLGTDAAAPKDAPAAASARAGPADRPTATQPAAAWAEAAAAAAAVTGAATAAATAVPSDGNGLGCTVVGLADRTVGAVAIAQTMDLEADRDGTQVMLRTSGWTSSGSRSGTSSGSGSGSGGGGDGSSGGLASSEPAQLIASQSGLVGLCGGNAAGVSVVVNNLWQLPNAKHGLPVAFVVRGILRCRDFAEAVRFVETVYGNHFVCLFKLAQ